MTYEKEARKYLMVGAALWQELHEEQEALRLQRHVWMDSLTERARRSWSVGNVAHSDADPQRCRVRQVHDHSIQNREILVLRLGASRDRLADKQLLTRWMHRCLKIYEKPPKDLCAYVPMCIAT